MQGAAAMELRVGNGVLAGLVAAEYTRIVSKLEHVTLTAGQELYRAGQRIEAVYFPEDAVIAMIDRLKDGRSVEVGIIGREGMVGINIFLGGVVTADQAVVQLSGRATRMAVAALRGETYCGSPLQQLLLGYARTFLAVISQSVACSQHHDIDQRLARLLLSFSAYAGARELRLDQACIAALLGVRRAGVSVSAGRLQAQGVLTYRRGVIRIIDRRTLETKTCECRQFITAQYAQFRRSVTLRCAQVERDCSASVGVKKRQRSAGAKRLQPRRL
jgi:CRP-like cAMP-binding protein